MFDIEHLRLIWWILLGVLIGGFAITDGFDMGVAALFPLVTKNETERRIVLNTIGPVWEGNQVWIILGAGAIFAAWPPVYAVTFSSLYFLILLLLLTMGISRPVSFKYRSKLPNLFWRRFWDWIVVIGGVVPALLFGILIGNVLLGLPFYFNEDLHIAYAGSFLGMLHPFALWCGLTSLFMLMMHGGLFLAIKTTEAIRQRALFWSRIAACLFIICFALGGIWVAKGIAGYAVTNGVDPQGFSNPLHKTVISVMGGWMQNYLHYPFTMTFPVLGFAGAFLALLTAPFWNSRFAFLCSSIGIIGVIGTVGVTLFPFIIPSSINFTSSLLVWDASSSRLTLFTMLISAVFFMPIILLYTAWVYRVLRGKVERKMVEGENEHTAY